MKRLIIILCLVSTWVIAAPFPYDEMADANAMLKQALASAESGKRPVLVIFGANWCEDCRALDHTLKSSRNATLIAKEFIVVKVNVGNFDRNLDIDRAYGNPIKMGIPAVVVLSPGNNIIYATRAGELANARRMSETGIYEFFKQVVQSYNSQR